MNKKPNYTTINDLQTYLNSFYSNNDSDKKIINFFDSTIEKKLVPTKLLFKYFKKIFFNNTNYFGYCNPEGYICLRQNIAKRYFKTTNKYKNIIITSGGQESLYICLKHISKLLSKTTLKVGIEEYGYIGFQHITQELKHHVVKIPLNSKGIDIEKLEKIIKNNKIDVLYIIPDIQNPTGITYTNKNRRQLRSLQNKYGFYIIYDSCYRDLYYKKSSLKNISYFTNNKTFIVGSFSKTISPAIRTGWIYHSNNTNKIALIKRSINLFQSPIFQISVSWLLNKGYDEQIRHLNKILSLKKDLLIQTLKIFGMDRYFLWNNPAGGFYIWLRPKNKDIIVPIQRIASNKIIIAPGSFFSNNNNDKNYLRICYSNENCFKIYQAIKIIAGSFDQKELSHINPTNYLTLIKLILKINFYSFKKNVL